MSDHYSSDELPEAREESVKEPAREIGELRTRGGPFPADKSKIMKRPPYPTINQTLRCLKEIGVEFDRETTDTLLDCLKDVADYVVQIENYDYPDKENFVDFVKRRLLRELFVKSRTESMKYLDQIAGNMPSPEFLIGKYIQIPTAEQAITQLRTRYALLNVKTFTEEYFECFSDK